MTDAYRRIAPWYDRLLDPFIRSWRARGLDLFNPGKGAAVLEVGCGTGRPTGLLSGPWLSGNGHRYVIGHAGRCTCTVGRPCDSLSGRRGPAALPGRDPLTLFWHPWYCMKWIPAPVRPSWKIWCAWFARRAVSASSIIIPCPKRTVKGLGTRLLMRGIERSAGRRHYANYRHFLTTGGIFPPVKRLGLIVEDLKRASGGNIGIYRLRRGP
jgi:hypothetical protein